MTKSDTPFVTFTRATFSGQYRPWGNMRQRNLVSRVLYGMAMTALGLAALAASVLLVIFAASVAVAGAVGLGLMGLMAFVSRKPVRVTVRGRHKTDNGKGVYVARKTGSTWQVY
ncbi:hypothetical protein [Asticcacaulis sp. EMRT-3]|uniref:hypothetical protein n=1 Tax=Asticcacaulis sp. EMRT-3 TaxID=3040349 RepID=UPI0024AEB587|nr:hypothetical protein [Asticcacaulis sp. EMRT-3]MDI7773760.1 hypothetical protein [Asticcacaulis sp. EMRT-3]